MGSALPRSVKLEALSTDFINRMVTDLLRGLYTGRLTLPAAAPLPFLHTAVCRRRRSRLERPFAASAPSGATINAYSLTAFDEALLPPPADPL